MDNNNTKTTVTVFANQTTKDMYRNNMNDNWTKFNSNATNELTLGTLVWVVDKKEGWLSAQVVSIDHSKSELDDDTQITILVDSSKKVTIF